MKFWQDPPFEQGQQAAMDTENYREESSVEDPKSGSRAALRTRNPQVGSRAQSTHTRMQGT